MSLNDFLPFRERVLQDVALQDRLKDIADRDEFITLVEQLGGEGGFTFTRDDVMLAMQANRRAWIERMLG
jgi:hypothetical protein